MTAASLSLLALEIYDDLARDEFSDGASQRMLVEWLGESPGAIRAAWNELLVAGVARSHHSRLMRGQRRNPLSERTRMEVMNLHAQGVRPVLIARKLHLTAGQVGGIIRRCKPDVDAWNGLGRRAA